MLKGPSPFPVSKSDFKYSGQRYSNINLKGPLTKCPVRARSGKVTENSKSRTPEQLQKTMYKKVHKAFFWVHIGTRAKLKQ